MLFCGLTFSVGIYSAINSHPSWKDNRTVSHVMRDVVVMIHIKSLGPRFYPVERQVYSPLDSPLGYRKRAHRYTALIPTGGLKVNGITSPSLVMV